MDVQVKHHLAVLLRYSLNGVGLQNIALIVLKLECVNICTYHLLPKLVN